MTLNQLRYFQTIAKYENYHKAAEELYISQPSLSKSISSLETELGIALLEKAGRGVALTKSGALFLEYADRILQECNIAVYRMNELAQAGGRISIGYVFPLSSFYIPRVARRFLNEPGNEKATFSFHQNRTGIIIDNVKKGHLDVGFCAYVENEEELEFFPVLHQEIVMIVPLNHPLAQNDSASITELANYPVIGYDRLSGLGGYTKRLYMRLGIRPDIICECPDENSIQALVAEEFGIAIAARVPMLDEERVRILKISDMSLTHKIFMVWHKNHYHIPAISRFIDFIKRISVVD